MYKPIHLVPADTRIDFMRFHKPAFVLSVIMVIGSFVLLFTKGLNYGIDFAGGVLMEVQQEQPVDLAQLRGQLDGLNVGEITLQTFGQPNDVLIRIPQQAGGDKATQEAVAKIKTSLGDKWQYRRTETVGPKVGSELKSSAVWASMLAMLGIMAYVWFRYEWQFGVNALLALFHDCVTTVGLFSLTGMEFNLTTVAAVLTIAGYSVNDTVVIYDRIRYDMRRYKTMPLKELINHALNATLSRTTITSGLTLLSVLALAIWGGEVIRGFSIAMIWGIVIGTYSTICVATPLLLYMHLHRIRGKDEKAAADKAATEKKPASGTVVRRGT
ncbi:MAG TPA: protein translocase subunit SecF [Dongiaceae bacterium]|jgi:preprotein translocase SecF subunit|nr:protein translocase subunit SecF [Dongiaceae bacterium]